MDYLIEINWNTLSQSQPTIMPEPMQKILKSSLKDFSFLEAFHKV